MSTVDEEGLGEVTPCEADEAWTEPGRGDGWSAVRRGIRKATRIGGPRSTGIEPLNSPPAGGPDPILGSGLKSAGFPHAKLISRDETCRIGISKLT